MKRLILHIVIPLIFSGILLGQTINGVIIGTVRDAETGQPLTGSNIVVRGTLAGSATDRDGNFRLRPLPPGRYAVVASMVGFKTETVENVVLEAGKTVTLELSLRPVAIETEPIVVTASRREQSLREVPVTVSTMTAAALAERVNVTLDDALRYIPGVNLMQDQVNIRGSSGYSRGVGSRVLLLLDGLPFLTGDTGEINWETIPIGEVDRIEVVKGAGSALYGSSALGGVINVITREMPERPDFRFRVFSGLYDRPRYAEWDWSERMRFNSGLTLSYANSVGSLRYLVSATRTVDESYRENDVYHRWNLFSKLRYDLSEQRSLSLVVNMLDRQHGNYFWWKSLKEATLPAEIQRNRKVESRRGNVSLAYKEFLSERLFYTVKGMYFGNFWRDDSLGTVDNVSSSHVVQGDVQVTYEVDPKHILTFGVAANSDEVISNLFGDHPGFGLAAYLQDEFSVSDLWKLTAGIRYDVQKASVLDAASRLSPKVGAVYLASDATSVRGSVGWGFRYPSIGELYVSSSTNVSQLIIVPNINLRPEKSLTLELGITQSIEDFLILDAAVFSNDFKDLIEPGVKVRNIKSGPADTVGQDRAVAEFENVTRSRIQGAEMGLKIAWLDKLLTTDVGYTYVWPKDLVEQTVMKFRPRHLFYASAAISLSPLRCSMDYRFISRVERIDDNLVRLAPIIHGEYRVPIHVVDARVSAFLTDLGVPLKVGFNVKNIFNYHYVELIGNLAPPRTFVLSIEGTF